MNNFKLYEINTRVWIHRFSNEKKRCKMGCIPESYWDELAEQGIDLVWLMGIWSTNKEIIGKCCFEEYLTKSYRHALKDWETKDVIGSPFAIEMYSIDQMLGSLTHLESLKELLNSKGIKLILDFVPNHFSAGSKLVYSDPDIFLQADEEMYKRDPYTYFIPENQSRIFAHGRDPFFPAWQDTIQVNYFSKIAREYMIETLESLTKYCDGVRCDMAMLSLNNIFYNTWGGALSRFGFQKPETEFWYEAINRVKSKRNDFIFIAEAYWDLEWQLQQLGFDFTYDKKLTDRLLGAPVYSIRDHLKADEDYQKKSVRFIENHDEERAILQFGKEKSKAAAVVISTIQGMKFYLDGQFEGKKIKLPVQLGKEPQEPIIKDIQEFYSKLLLITKDEIFKSGYWELLEALPASVNNFSYQNILAWEWKLNSERRVIIINYSTQIAQCRLKLNVIGYQEELVLSDLLNDQSYLRSAEEINKIGLFIDLKPYQSHIFSI